MEAERKREQRLKLLEDDIGRALAESAQSGELASAPSWGKPLNLGDGYEQTPPELRMAFKALKDAGCVPPEVELMQRIGRLQDELDAAPEAADAEARRRQIIELRQSLALMLERLRANGFSL